MLVQAGGHLTRAEACDAFLPILAGDYAGADVAWGALLAGVHAHPGGPQPDEVLGLIDAILAYDPALARQLSAPFRLPGADRVVAITGSGKETFKTFNVSTAAALVAACHPGLGVVKPAGRATSANTGAAEVLEHLGIRLPISFAEMTEHADRTGFCVFDYHLIAQRYGPRYEGRFHHLHPLSHVTPWLFVPVALDALVFGIAEPNTTLAAAVISRIGPARAAVVCTEVGNLGNIDEHAPFGIAHVTTVKGPDIDTAIAEHRLPCDLANLRQPPGPKASAAFVEAVLAADAPTCAVDLVIANAALMLSQIGMAIDDAATACREYLATGRATRRLDDIRHASMETRR
jgi:anthranilate phosphoribosyltransferase